MHQRPRQFNIGSSSARGIRSFSRMLGGPPPPWLQADGSGPGSGIDFDIGEGPRNQLVGTGDIPNFPHLLAVQLPIRPLIPGFLRPIVVQDPALEEALSTLLAQGNPYVGAFLEKSATENDIVEEDEHKQQHGEIGIIKEATKDISDLHEVGMLAQISRLSVNVEGGLQVLLQGHRRVKIEEAVSTDPVLQVKVEHIRPNFDKNSDMIKALTNEILSTMREILNFNPLFKEQLHAFLGSADLVDPGRLADVAAGLTNADSEELQEILSIFDVEQRMNRALLLLKKELELSKLQQEISRKVEEKVSENHRKFLLQEQLKNIKRELGVEKDDKETLVQKFRDQIGEKDVPKDAMETIEEELAKLSSLEQASSEFNVTRNYLDWLTGLPWGIHSEENFDITKAQEVLDRDHYGLEDVKNRILEFIAVGKLLGAVPQGKIVCLVGPPGVGKTSIGKSIADALNREFYRFSVGGLFDVAEIKGHRRTYVGAMPGKLIQCLKKTGTSNPVVMIDEIDKIGQGHRGDPSSALLEVLDPSQNGSFMDHYLDIPVDLSRVLFICTANMTETIPGPLADRMEFIRLSGYIMQEKIEIAKSYLAPNALKETGLTKEDIHIEDDSIESLVRWYCREAGVRNLQKHINQIYRKAALNLVRDYEKKEMEAKESSPEKGDTNTSKLKESLMSLFVNSSEDEKKESKDDRSKALKRPLTSSPIKVTTDNLRDYVGKPIFTSDKLYEHTPVGVVMGLAFNQLGGATLYIEAIISDVQEGKDGKSAGMHCTGQLGDVMRESSQIAYTVAKRTLYDRNPSNDFFQRNSLHMHVPEGATPKDGPSAGITMVTALLSLAMNNQVKKDLAMTGEITLTGRVLPIGGVKEKTIAARRELAKTLIFPKANEKDFEELPEVIREGLEVHFVETYDEVYKIAFETEKE